MCTTKICKFIRIFNTLVNYERKLKSRKPSDQQTTHLMVSENIFVSFQYHEANVCYGHYVAYYITIETLLIKSLVIRK